MDIDEAEVVGLFEGYGGLTSAVRAVLGGRLVAYSEIEPAACLVLAQHHPDVPNLGDITAIDWAAAEALFTPGRPRIMTGGFPCTDVSAAGAQLGLRPGTRSGLWIQMAYGIGRLRPDLVVIENVRGLTYADAESPAGDVEPCPWCMGEHPDRPLRALGAVLGDLADLGFDAEWIGIPASDAGAPHGRLRIFILAWPRDAAADAGRGRLQRRPVCGGLADSESSREGEGLQRQRRRDSAGDAGSTADADPSRVGRREGRTEPEGLVGGPDAALGGALAVANPDSVGPVRSRGARRGRAGSAHHDHAAADPGSDGREGREGREERDLGTEGGQPAPFGGDAARRVLDWGAYTPAIRRWERILARPAPAPTMTGQRGGQQLSPLFVEWMMGLPESWVTGVKGVNRNAALKMLGNGVVPQQAELALRHLLVASGHAAEAVAA